MSKLKIGVFGANRGMTMVNVIVDHPYATLVAVCDKFVPALEQCKKMTEKKGMKVEYFTDFDSFIECDMDAVVLANYANEHAPFAIRLLESGRHVMSEVLPVQNMAEAVALIEAVEKTGKIYAYAENYCFFTTTFEMKRRYEMGDIGEVTYAEGEYVHDCSSIWPQITYGQRDHWRNNMTSTFYCTHGIGPMLYITGQRPINVVGMELPNTERERNLGRLAGDASVMIMQLDNGGMIRHLTGHLRREPGSINYQIYGSKGSMETDRWDGSLLHIYREGENYCHGENKAYKPEMFDQSELACITAGHGGSDFYTTNYFIGKILGDEISTKYSIDVYSAIDMGIPGILGYRSIYNDNIPIKIPNLRNKEEREQYRFDVECSDLKVAGKQYVAPHSSGLAIIPDKTYDFVKDLWEKGLPGKPKK